MSDSVRPHRWQPTRLCCPCDSPGKNTGVGCHFLLQCMKVKSENEVAQSCLTLSDPMDCSPPGSSVHGIFQARVLEWGAIAFSVTLLQLALEGFSAQSQEPTLGAPSLRQAWDLGHVWPSSGLPPFFPATLWLGNFIHEYILYSNISQMCQQASNITITWIPIRNRFLSSIPDLPNMTLCSKAQESSHILTLLVILMGPRVWTTCLELCYSNRTC